MENENQNVPVLEESYYDSLFVKSLYAALKSGKSGIFKLKRSLGLDISADMSAYMSFMDIVGGSGIPYPILRKYESIYFFVACLFYSFEKGDSNKVPVTAETLLGRLYQNVQTSESIKNRIVNLIDTENADDVIFQKKLLGLLRLCKDQKRAEESLNYVYLIKALCRWDNDDKVVRKNWAKKIALN